jgi:hypothetical protein
MKTFKDFAKLKNDLSAYTYVLLKQNSDKKDLDAALAMSAANTNKEIYTITSSISFS